MAVKKEKYLKPAIKDLTELVLVIDKASEDNKFTFREVLKMANEAWDLKDDILSLPEVKKEWMAISSAEREQMVIDIAKELEAEFVIPSASNEIVKEAIRLIFSFMRFADILKKYKK